MALLFVVWINEIVGSTRPLHGSNRVILCVNVGLAMDRPRHDGVLPDKWKISNFMVKLDGCVAVHC
jgi:hypothetical protein